MESGDSFLFDEQVISITSQGREHSYALIIDAIKRAVRASFTSKQMTSTPIPSSASVEATQSTPERVHDLDSEPESKADVNEFMQKLRRETARAILQAMNRTCRL